MENNDKTQQKRPRRVPMEQNLSSRKDKVTRKLLMDTRLRPHIINSSANENVSTSNYPLDTRGQGEILDRWSWLYTAAGQ